MFELTQDKIIPFNLMTHKNDYSSVIHVILSVIMSSIILTRTVSTQKWKFSKVAILNWMALDWMILKWLEYFRMIVIPFFQNRIELGKLWLFLTRAKIKNDFNQLQMAIIEIIRKLFLEIHPFWWFSWMFISLTVLTSFISVTFKWLNLISAIN